MAKKLPKVLILNDTISESRTIHSILMGNNYDPIACREAMNALFLLSEDQFDLMIFRVNFKDMVLQEFMLLITENEKTSSMPLLLVADPDELVELKKVMTKFNFDDVVKTPLKGINILKKVDLMLGKK